MAAFKYFAPGGCEPTVALAREWGLGYAINHIATRQTSSGPKGMRGGHVFGDSARMKEQRLGLYDSDKWEKIPGRQGKVEVWVGYSKEFPPQPADVERVEILPGFDLKVADSRIWRVPVVRAFDFETVGPRCLLPSFMTLDANGYQTPGKVKEAYQWLWDLTEPAWQAMISDAEMTQDDCLPIAAGLFQANYAVDAMELHLMNVFDRDRITPFGVVSLAIDYTTFAAWRESKKKTNSAETDDGSAMPLGEMADSPATPQPAPTY